MAWYRTGTVAVTNGSAAVTLTGGNALTNIFPGDTFWGPDGEPYEIAAISSETTFTLATDYQGPTATGQPYAIQPTGSTGALRLLYEQVSTLVTHYQTGRDAWAAAAAGTIKGRKSGSGAAEDLSPDDVMALLASAPPGTPAGDEKLAALQGGAAVGLAARDVLSLLTGAAASALTGGEKLAVLQGGDAVGATLNQLLSRAAGQVIPVEIGGARIATITGTGVGIGSTNPETGLAVRGATPEKARVRIEGVGTDVGGSLDLFSEGSVFRIQGRKTANGGGAVLTQVGVRDLATFDSGGNFMVGQSAVNISSANTAPGVSIAPIGYLKVTRNENCMMLHRTEGVGSIMNFAQGVSNIVGSISVTASSTAYNTTSDYRLKGDFTEIDPASAIERVKQLRPGRFPWLSTGEVVDGFLAHEVQAVVPEAVTGHKDQVEEIGDATGYRERDPETGVPILGTQETLTGITQAECPEGYEWTKTGERPVYQGIDQSKLVPLLAAGLKAAIGEIEALRARVAALEAAA